MRALQAICDTLIPSIAAGRAPADYWQRQASDLQVPQMLAQAVATRPPAEAARLRGLLRLLEAGPGALLLGGAPAAFSRLDRQRREALLLRMAHSPLPPLRQAFQALKRLTGFLYAAVTDAGGLNPGWAAMGYQWEERTPSLHPPLQPLSITADTTLDADVCIIGSGAGGAVAAAALAHAGLAVLVLEMGPYLAEDRFTDKELEMTEQLFLDRGMTATRDLSVAMLAGSCLGGGTVINWCTSFRPPGDLLQEWAAEHGLTGLTGPDFAAGLDLIEQRLHVTTTESEDAPTSNNGRLAAGLKALGWHAGVIPRNVRECGAVGCCSFGCRLGAKQSALRTFLQDARAAGAQFVTDAAAEQVLIAHGRAAGVSARVTDPATGRAHRLTVRAPRVVVAGGALHSPAVLLRSGIGLPSLGRHLHLHPTTAVVGLYPHPVLAWWGIPMAVYSDQFARQDGAYGCKLETAPGHPGLAALALPWQGGEQFKADLLRLQNAAMWIVLTRDRDGGRVRVDREGRAYFDYRLSAYDRAHMIRGMQAAARVHAAAGAGEIWTLYARRIGALARDTGGFTAADLDDLDRRIAAGPTAPNRLMLFSAHQMGTCRMGTSPRHAVCDPTGQVFGVRGLYVADSSLFPTASGVNPMLTVMGLSYWVAAQMV